MKPNGQGRLLGRLLRDGLATPDGEEHRLTPAGYKAVGMEAPSGTGRSKKALVAELLRRPEGASLAELVDATGWLPHTTRAALSRLRSAGQELTRTKRQDGATAYRLEPAEVEPAPKPRRARRAKGAEDVRAAT